MITKTSGDILKADAEALVNTVNCVGVMGRGIALQFKKAFPENFKAYKAACDRKLLHPGHMLVHDLGYFENPRYVINFPTKRHWKGKSKEEDIRTGLEALVSEVRTRKIRSLAIPPLGCGLGGLNWQQVRPLIEEALSGLSDVEILLFEPKGAPKPEVMVKRTDAPKMTAGRAALLGVMRRYLAGLMDTSVSLLEIHKLMYFMQEAGLDLKLKYNKASYGPYAENLRHVLSHIEGHFITGYGDAEDKPDRRIVAMAEATKQAERFLQTNPEIQASMETVSGLIDGFETPLGLELLSTVHWVNKYENAETLEETQTLTYQWGTRKKAFTANQIQVAWKVLKDKGWLQT